VRFYLGVHHPSWLSVAPVPLFVSDRRLRQRRSLPVARSPWALDSGAFSELRLYGKFQSTVAEYAERVLRYRDEIGQLAWAAPQDWMCEAVIRAQTRKSVLEHQHRTIMNVLRLRERLGSLVIPVLQGWEIGEYAQHVDDYGAAGLDLTREPLVGLGGVCRRQATSEILALIAYLSRLGLRLHGFGVKTTGLARYRQRLASADSMAWSYTARRERQRLPGHTHANCANCFTYALQWRDQVLAA
jgi:hypothetical protein